jgi:hypothetical protein
VDEHTLKKHRLFLNLVALEAEFSRNQQVSQELVAAHELVKGLIAKLQRWVGSLRSVASPSVAAV